MLVNKSFVIETIVSGKSINSDISKIDDKSLKTKRLSISVNSEIAFFSISINRLLRLLNNEVAKLFSASDNLLKFSIIFDKLELTSECNNSLL